ncbi:MAG: type II secretion system protein M [Pseudomonadota bacterium]
MKDWFMELDARERMLLIGAGSFLALVLVFLLVIEPLYASTASLEESIEAKRVDLAYVQRGAQQIVAMGQAGRNTRAQPSSRPLVVIVDQTARSAGLGNKLNQNQAGADGSSIKVRFEDAPFDSIVPWLSSLGTRHGIEVESGTIERSGGPGLVDVSLTLKR